MKIKHTLSQILKNDAIKTTLITVPFLLYTGLNIQNTLNSNQRKINSFIQETEEKINLNLDSLQYSLYEVEWDGFTDNTDDTKHLNTTQTYPVKQLLIDTLSGYVGIDGHNYYEGMALINYQGNPVETTIANIRDNGEYLEKEEFDEHLVNKPWLANPWLPNYKFVIDYFKKNPEEQNFFSNFIDFDNRKLIILGSQHKEKDGNIEAIICQMSVKQVYEDYLFQGIDEQKDIFWLSDRVGNIGYSTHIKAKEIADKIKEENVLQELLNEGTKAEELGLRGAKGTLDVSTQNKDYKVFYRTLESKMVIGYVQDCESINQLTSSLNIQTLKGIGINLAIAAIWSTSMFGIYRKRREWTTFKRLVGTISHELNNPLTGAKGYIELIKLTKDEKKQKRLLTKLESTQNEMAQKIKTLENLTSTSELEYSGQQGQKTMFKIGE